MPVAKITTRITISAVPVRNAPVGVDSRSPHVISPGLLVSTPSERSSGVSP